MVLRKADVEAYEAEIRHLHEFILQVADRLFLAAEVLSIKAERKGDRNKTATTPRNTGH